MESILQQYLATVPLRHFQWKDATVFSEAFQLSVLQEVVRYPLCLTYSPPPKYQMAFLKYLMTKAEADGCPVEEEIYEIYAKLIALPSVSSDSCWKSYHLANGEFVTLRESTNIVSKGTTGLTTWQAAFRFVEWISDPDITSLFQSKSVLELGSGVGLTGLSICLKCAPKSFCFTDSHLEVLERLRENVHFNITKSDKSSIGTSVHQLDWTHHADVDCVLETLSNSVDYVIATDVVFDPTTIDSFVQCLQYILRKSPQAVAYVASTIRNIETYQHFLTGIELAGLQSKGVDHSSPRLFHYDHSQNITILEVKP